MALLWNSLSWVLLLAGSFFLLVGGIGILRFPDLFSRLHPAGVVDTIGSLLILSGLMIQAGPSQTAAKLVLIFFFLLFTSPVSTHVLGKAALKSGLLPWTK